MLANIRIGLIGAAFLGLLLVGVAGGAKAQGVPADVQAGIDAAIAAGNVDDLETALASAIEAAGEDSAAAESALQYAADQVAANIPADAQEDYLTAMINGSVLTNPDLSLEFQTVLVDAFPEQSETITNSIEGTLASLGIETAAGGDPAAGGGGTGGPGGPGLGSGSENASQDGVDEVEVIIEDDDGDSPTEL